MCIDHGFFFNQINGKIINRKNVTIEIESCVIVYVLEIMKIETVF